MVVNRSVPPSTAIPVLVYDDVAQASGWLCDVSGFTERLRIGNHRAQLIFGDGAVIVTGRDTRQPSASPEAATVPPRSREASHSLLVDVEDADRHHEHALQRGARILQSLTNYPYGERQYVAEDLGGHQ